MAAGNITHVSIPGVLLSNTLTAFYTVPANQVVISIEIDVLNVDTASHQVEIQMVESPGSATGNAKKVIGESTATGLAPGQPRSYLFNPMLAVGDKIHMKADTANVVSARAGLTLKEV